MKEAVADGRVSEEERRVIWCVANQNNLLVTLQMLCFVGKVLQSDWSRSNEALLSLVE